MTASSRSAWATQGNSISKQTKIIMIFLPVLREHNFFLYSPLDEVNLDFILIQPSAGYRKKYSGQVTPEPPLEATASSPGRWTDSCACPSGI
jgi:hypothetical protein